MSTIQPGGGEGVIVTTIRLPVDLRNEVKIQAIRMGRSFNTHVAMILREAAGADLGGHAPAAKHDHKCDQEEPKHAGE